MKPPYDTERRRTAALNAKRQWLCEKCGGTFLLNRGAFRTHVRFCGKEQEIFYRKVNKNGPNGCWIFGGCKDKWGYGQHGIKGRRNQAHRLSYVWANGPILPEQVVMHTCDTPACVNPAHLRLGTHAENHADMRAKGRIAVGEQYPNAKLTEQAVREIRRDFRKEGPYKQSRSNARELADRYGVDLNAIQAVIYRGAWRHVK